MFPSIYIEGKCTYTYKHGICTLYSYIYAGKNIVSNGYVYMYMYTCVYILIYIIFIVSHETFYIQRPIIVSIIVYHSGYDFFRRFYNCIFYISIAIIVFILCCLYRFLCFFVVIILLKSYCFLCIFYVIFVIIVLYIQLYRCIYNCIYIPIFICFHFIHSYNCL